jgi:nitrogen PTS system EIIA component
MKMQSILKPHAIRAELSAKNKKALLQQLAAIAQEVYGIDQHTAFECLHEREKLGSTGFGTGISIPHGKMPQLDKVIAVYAKLSKPIEFEAMDGLPVDMAFMLLSPSDDGQAHLKALASISRLMRDKAFVEKLRGTTSNDGIYALFGVADREVSAD